MECYILKICDGEHSSLGIANAYDFHQLLSSAHAIACLENLPSSIMVAHKRHWTPYILRRIVNEAPDSQDGNGVTTLCSHFLIFMHEASRNDNIEAFIDVLHDLVAWLYMNYEPSQILDANDND